jgi:hypothetical protein
MRWPSAWLAACSCAVFVAACGGNSSGPTLPQSYAATAQAQAHRAAELLEGGRTCMATRIVLGLQRETIRALNAHRIPGPLQEELLAHVNDLVDVVRCGPPVEATPSPAARARRLVTWLRDHS